MNYNYSSFLFPAGLESSGVCAVAQSCSAASFKVRNPASLKWDWGPQSVQVILNPGFVAEPPHIGGWMCCFCKIHLLLVRVLTWFELIFLFEIRGKSSFDSSCSRKSLLLWVAGVTCSWLPFFWKQTSQKLWLSHIRTCAHLSNAQQEQCLGACLWKAQIFCLPLDLGLVFLCSDCTRSWWPPYYSQLQLSQTYFCPRSKK